MIKRTEQLKQLNPSYLFSQVAEKVQDFQAHHPHCDVIPLAVGDTTQPLECTVTQAFESEAKALGTPEGYQGYPPSQGKLTVREKISSRIYQGLVDPDEIFISDGAKCDYGRLQYLFSSDHVVGLQDPCYPVFFDLAQIKGNEVILFPLNEDLFFSLEDLKQVDLFVLCSPNNPTGVAYSKQQLQDLVTKCLESNTLLIVDAAYSQFIQNPNCPKSIYEIPDAKKIAIEINSLSKPCGFTGIRLGWTVVPKELMYHDQKTSIHTDFKRIYHTTFNGASLLSQAGALAALSDEGWEGTQKMMQYYLENASLLREALKPYRVFGGNNTPFIWFDIKPLKSWDAFDLLLDRCHIVTTPGVGFGPSGEGYIRLSGFGSREHTKRGAEKLHVNAGHLFR